MCRKASHRTHHAVLAVLAASLLLAIAARPAHALPPRFYGVVDQGGLLVRDFPKMHTAGVGTLRILVRWAAVQKQAGPCEPGPYRAPALLDPGNLCNWSSIDYLVGNAAANGVEPLPFVLGSPGFAAQSETTPPLGSASARAAWQKFLGAAVQRYGPGGTYWTSDYPSQHPGSTPLPIRHWQIWNEENSPAFWKPRPDVKQYATLLALSSQAIKARDPGAVVIAGGMHDAAKHGIKLDAFVRQLYAAGGASSFDAIGVHPYAEDIKGVSGQIERLRKEMNGAGDGGAGIWVSEIGWASDGPKKTSHLVVGKRGQAKMLTNAFKLFRANQARWQLLGVNWYAWTDVAPGGTLCAWCPWSGLVDKKGKSKPALKAFEAFT
jgi:hypothetical protein